MQCGSEKLNIEKKLNLAQLDWLKTKSLKVIAEIIKVSILFRLFKNIQRIYTT